MDDKKKVMLVGPDAVKSGSYVNYNVDDGVIGASIREGQEIHLQSIIGSNLLYRLQELVYNSLKGNADSIDDDENEIYKTLLDDYVEPYMVNKVQALICVPVSFKVRNLGVSKNSDTNTNAPTLQEVMAVQKRYNTMAARYATYLSKFLCIHRSELPELDEGNTCGCGDFVKPVIGKMFVETGLVLGSTEGSGCDCR